MVAGGEQSGYGILTVREQLWMFSQFYGLPLEGRLAPGRRADRGGRARGAEGAAGQHAVDRPAPEDELRPRPPQRPVDLLPRRADARPRRRRRPLRPRAGPRLEGGGPGPDGPPDDPLHGRGRRALRPDRDRRPRPDPRPRHARRAEAARPARVGLPPRARPARRRDGGRSGACPASLSAAAAAAQDDGRDRQTVEVNLALEDDAALGSVVGALAGIVARTSSPCASREPSLEDVFVELVGRGFDEEPTTTPRDARPTTATTAGARPDARSPRHGPRARRARGGGGGRMSSRLRLPPDGEPAGGGRLVRRRQILATDLRSVVGRAYPRVTGMFREKSWVFFEILLPFLATSAFVFVYRALAGAAGVHRLRRARRGDDGVLAERHLDDGPAAVVGEEPGQPRALLRGADEHHVGPVRDGLRRLRHELDPGRRRPRRRDRASTACRSRSTSGSC